MDFFKIKYLLFYSQIITILKKLNENNDNRVKIKK